MACLNFFRFKVQKAESRQKNVAWSPFAILFAANVTLKLLYFRKTSFLIRDDSETSCHSTSVNYYISVLAILSCALFMFAYQYLNTFP